MVKKLSALAARKKFGELLEGVYEKGDEYVIERGGEPMAAVVPVWQLQDRQIRRERLFKMIGQVWERNKRVPPKIIEREVENAVEAVRAKRKRRMV